MRKINRDGLELSRHGSRVRLLPLALSLLLLAGCAGKPAPDGTAPLPPAEVQTDSQPVPPGESPHALQSAESNRTSLRFLFPGQQPKGWDAVRSEIETRIAGTVSVSLDFEWLPFETYLAGAKLLDASGDPCDAFCVGKPQPHYPDFTGMAREGKLADITRLLLDSVPALAGRFTEEELAYGRVDGKQYAVPSLDPQAYCTYLMVDDALLNQSGIKDINSFEQYESFLQFVKESAPDRIPGTIANSVDTLPLFARASGYAIVDEKQALVCKWDDPEHKVIAWETTAEFRKAVSFVSRWIEKGYLTRDPDPIKTASYVYYGSLYPPSDETANMTISTGDGNPQQSPPLRTFYLYREQQVQRDNPVGSFFHNGSFVFPAASADVEASLRFLEWVHSDKRNYDLVQYGIEGTDYVLRDGVPTLPDGMDFDNRSYMYWDGSWALGNLAYTDHLAADKTPDGEPQDSYRTFLDKNSRYAPFGALYPDYGSVEAIADARSRAIQAFERRISQCEKITEQDIDTYLKNLEACGSATLIEAVQQQVDKSAAGS